MKFSTKFIPFLAALFAPYSISGTLLAAPALEDLLAPDDAAVVVKTKAGAGNVFSAPDASSGGQRIGSAVDRDLGSKHFIKAAPGETPGFVITPSIGESVLTKFRFATGNDAPARDPITVTIEGSNDAHALEAGNKSFTPLYQGPAGLDTDPGRSGWGAWIAVPNTRSFKSYRVLVTKARGVADGVQYAEVAFVGIPKKSRIIPPPEQIKISFRPAGNPAPEGFVGDFGRDFSQQGPAAFGWETKTPHSANKKEWTDDPVLCCGARFPRDSKWQIALENGLYDVTVCVGSFDDDHEVVPLLVQDVPYFKGQQVFRNSFSKQTQTVSVTDGRLTLKLDESRFDKEWDKKRRFVTVSFIEIRKVAKAQPERSVRWSVDSSAETDREFSTYAADIRSTSKPATDLLNTLWYKRPAKIWDEGLPLGNGRLGAVVYGDPVHERIQLNEDTLWDGAPGLPMDNPNGKAGIDEARKMIFANQPEDQVWEYIFKNVFNRADGKFGPFMFDYLNGGDVMLRSENAPVENYYRSLDLSDAIATTRYRMKDVDYLREVFSSAETGVLVARLTASKPGSISFSAEARDGYGGTITAEGTDTLVINGHAPAKNRIPGVIRYQRRVKIVPEGGTVAVKDGQLVVTGANAVTMLVAIRTNFITYKDVTGDPEKRARADIDAASAKSYAELRAAHVADQHKYYDRMTLDLGKATTLDLPTDERIREFQKSGDPQMVALVFQFGRYLMIACSRPGSQAANLQGIWSSGYTGAWGGKYTVNINIQMIYWLAEVGNLSEFHQPFFDLIAKTADTGRSTAQAYYGARGWVDHHNTDIWGYTHPIDGTAGMWPMAGAWFCDHIWEHYAYTLDKEFLKKMYPIMHDACLFYLDSLVKDPRSGWLVTAPSMSPENGGIHAAPTMDVQLLNSLFSRTVAAARILGIDADFQQKLLATQKQLPPMQIGKWHQLQEWTDGDFDDPNNKNRHVSHLYGLYPGDQIDPRKTPDLFKAAKVSLIARGDEATGWSLGWKTNFWARMRDGNHAYDILKLLIKPSYNAETQKWGSGLYPNMFDAHPPFQIDGNFGVAAGILEMLVQSQNGEIELLPALPSVWPAGSVTGMRVRGGFEIDFKWAGGKPAQLVVRSKGGTNCRVRFGEKVVNFAMQPGATRVLGPNLQVLK
ncbi:MAG TPA: glycoside hydrolase family 95 protein [Chthoniobacterales bacterium]|nr:glycoside hydrolase family 95 protein [Chthoniobacterales bacterium]